MTVPTIKMPFLITSRMFPKDSEELQRELAKSYTETALAINNRTIGIFDLFQVISGNQWFNEDDPFDAKPIQRRQSYRRVYTFGAIAAGATLTLPHDLLTIETVMQYWAQVITAVPDFRTVPYASATVVTEQIEMRVTATDIIIINGATSPNITSGFAVLEYILND